MTHHRWLINPVLLFLVFQTVLKNVKNFRESYVFHCLVIKVVCLATALLFYHVVFSLSRTSLSFFKLYFQHFVLFNSFSSLSQLFRSVKNFFFLF